MDSNSSGDILHLNVPPIQYLLLGEISVVVKIFEVSSLPGDQEQNKTRNSVYTPGTRQRKFYTLPSESRRQMVLVIRLEPTATLFD